MMAINSAIAAFYYLRLVAYPLFDDAGDEAKAFGFTPMRTRPAVGALGAAGVVLMTVFAGPIMNLAHHAVRPARHADPVAGSSSVDDSVAMNADHKND